MRSLSIECVGFPGSGKTTFVKDLEPHLLRSGEGRVITCPNAMFWEARRALPTWRRGNRFVRLGSQCNLAFDVVISQRKLLASTARSMVSLLCAGGGRKAVKERLCLYQYWLIDAYTRSMMRCQDLQGYTYVNSEGIVHHAGCLAVQAGKEEDVERVFLQLLHSAPLPDLVVHISVPKDLAKARMHAREGQDALHCMDPQWIQLMYDRWTDVIATMEQHIARQHIPYIRIDNESDDSRAKGVEQVYALLRTMFV